MDRRILIVFIFVFPVVLLITGFLVDSPAEIWQGLQKIMTSSSILLHDYFAVGGLGATLVNAGLCGIICCLIVVVLKIDINGPFIAAIYTVIGFAFFGKNVVNVWPIFIGVALYSKVQRVPLNNFALVALFGTTLAPLGSLLAFGPWLSGGAGLAAGLLFGVAAGFVLPPLASHMLRFHDGYNIYNIGFTGGITGSFIIAVLRSFDLTVSPVAILSGEFDLIMKIFFTAIFASLIAGGLALSRTAPEDTPGLRAGMKKIHASSGRLVSDFVQIGGLPASIFNMGIMGLVSSGFVLLLRGEFNGPVIGGILTVVGFAAFGKHIKNCLPVMAGVVAASLVTIWETSTTGVVIAGLFGTTLAPIAGQHGIIAGVAAGFFHLSVVMNVGVLHGGVNLYNNGFAGGFVASFLVPIIDVLKKDKREEKA